MRVAIVIPVYKDFEQLQASEIRSINRSLEIFQKQHVFLVAPHHLELKEYHKYFSGNPNHLGEKRFADYFFSSFEGYNKLLMQPLFYKSFKPFDYILICQTDAYVFRNDLDYWCSLGYDYIGAPIIDSVDKGNHLNVQVGLNGGFSLRKVKSHLRILHSFYIVLPSKVKNIENSGSSLLRFLKKIRWFFTYNSFWLWNSFNRNEDLFWSWGVPQTALWFRVPPWEIASQFGFEKYPRELFIFNNQKLPFGCHAWQKHDPEFWSHYIQ